MIIAEPGQQQQSPRDGTWLEFHRAIDTQPTVLQFLAIAVHRATKRKRFFNRGTSRNKTQTVLNRGARDTRRAGLLGTGWSSIEGSSPSRASSSNPHGRGLGWSSIEGSTPGRFAGDLVGVRSSDQSRAGPAAAIPTGWDLVGVRSRDRRRAGLHRVSIYLPRSSSHRKRFG